MKVVISTSEVGCEGWKSEEGAECAVRGVRVDSL